MTRTSAPSPLRSLCSGEQSVEPTFPPSLPAAALPDFAFAKPVCGMALPYFAAISGRDELDTKPSL
eukprot:scaffold1557_cov246-Pinguiococcus_pyrenoidosus.AAC.13